VKKVLVVYASRAGSTAEVAEHIARALSDCGAIAKVVSAEEAHGTLDHDAFVVGSAVHHGGWLPEAVRFVEARRRSLSQCPVALFSVGMEAVTAEGRARSLGYGEKVAALLETPPVAVAAFPGAWLPRRTPGLMGVVLRLGTSERDERDLDEVRSWAFSMAPRLLSELELASV
jgi:menaquinone-dependent protoporphyrinogen oxidase